MGLQLAETTDVERAIAEEQSLPPGVYEVRFHIIAPISQEELNELHEHLLTQGVDVVGSIVQDVKGLWYVSVKYRKHPPAENIAFAPLLIPLIPTFLVAVLVGIGIFRLSDITQNLTKLLVVGGIIGITTLVILRRPAERVAEAYARRL